jgi:membrane protease YdiL (CAAX protease family)
MPVKLTSTHYRIVGITVLVAAVSLGIAIKYFSRAFPEASIDFRVSRTDSESIAASFLAARHLDGRGYRHAAAFDYDDDSKLYLERTLGLERMNQLTSGPIHLWRWSHRWFKPQQIEEFRVDVTPQGTVAAFAREIAETAPGASLDQTQARLVAETFLRDAMQRNLDDLEFMEASSQKRPARVDHTFTWKQKSVDLGDGSLRVEVEVSGDQVGGYREYVKVPEQWQRDYEKLRSRNVSADLVDEAFWVLLSVAMLGFLILRLRDRDVPLRTAAGFGTVAIVLYFLSQVNTFSLAQFDYRTTDSYTSFVASYFTGSLLKALGLGALIFLVVAAAEPMYREGFPGQMSLRRYLSWNGLRTRSFFVANIVGIGLTFFFFAYQAVFYVVANKLGAWAPSDINFSNDLNTRIPWVGVLFTGFIPAVTEEMQFRAFAIPFLKKILGSWPLAIVLAAFNWGFLHSLYPNQPFFIRGLEVGAGGIIMGLVMMRFGIVATLIWHYSVDALYTAFILLRSSNHYLMVSGGATAGIMLVPLLLGLVAYWRTGTFTEEESLTNAQEGMVREQRSAPPPEQEAPLAYRPLSRKRFMMAAAITGACVLVALIPAYEFGDGIKVRTTRPDALRAADQYLAQRAVEPGTFHRVAWLDENVDPSVLRYLLERRSLKESDQIYRQATAPLLWEVRYFRPLQKEEYLVFVDAQTGKVFDYQHEVDEDSPGASLASEDARKLAEQAIEERGYTPTDFKLVDSTSNKRKEREDYKFTWKANAGDRRNVGGAEYRLDVDIAGSQVVGFRRFFKLPEDWERAHNATRLPNVVLSVLGYLLLAGLVCGVLIVFVQQVRSHQIPWRPAAWVGVAVFVLMALSQLNGLLPAMDRVYPTSIPLSAYHLMVVIELIIAPLLAGMLAWLLVGLAASLYPDAWRILRASARRIWSLDATMAVAITIAVAAAIHQVNAVLTVRLHAYAPVSLELVPGGLDSLGPGAGAWLGALLVGILLPAVASVLIWIVRQGWRMRSWWLWAGALLVIVRMGPSGAHSLPQFATGSAMSALPALAILALVAFIYRDNVAAYVGAVFAVEVTDPLVALISQPVAFYRWQGVLLAVLSAAFLWWLLAPGGKPPVRAAAADDEELPIAD